jgi:hypothetical protein
VITLDADLQNDPADIPRFLSKLEEGYDVVCGWRRNRQDGKIKSWLSFLGNRLQRLITGAGFHDISCTLRACRRECLEDLALQWDGQHRFIPLMLYRQGYRIGEVTTHHRKRRFGASKYRHRRTFKVIRDFGVMIREGGQRKGREGRGRG